MALDLNEKIRRLRELLQPMDAEQDLTAAKESAKTESAGRHGLEMIDRADSAVDKILHSSESLTPAEVRTLEAIILPKVRPVAFVLDGDFTRLGDPWLPLNDAPIKAKIVKAFPAIGRVEMPDSDTNNFIGTAFIVGPGVLMTNRHVAEVFTNGVGRSDLRYSPDSHGVNFRRHRDDAANERSRYFKIRRVAMVHPYWDMALLHVTGLDGITPLILDATPPEEGLIGRDIFVVGYPAFNRFQDPNLQQQEFGGHYGMKRMQPGKLRARVRIPDETTGHTVEALPHDATTLTGNSGSAVINLKTGTVCGLHFSGEELKANYAVPAYELARDPRVRDAGVKFTITGGFPAAAREVETAWSGVERVAPASLRPTSPPPSPSRPPAVVPPPSVPPTSVSIPDGTGRTITVPLHITLSLGEPMLGRGITTTLAPDAMPGMATEGTLRPPVIHPHLNRRGGFRRNFLGFEVPMPRITGAGRDVVAKLADDSFELKYHRFSVVMHKDRRLALVCAANVDWRPAGRLLNNGRRFSRDELFGAGPNSQEKWVTDPRIPDSQQLPDVFYNRDRQAFHKGHLIRREDVAYGNSFEDIQKGNNDTYHTPNCSPQTPGFNVNDGEQNWGDLENLIQRITNAETICMFAGPVLADDDPEFEGFDSAGRVTVRIPRQFWKIVVANDARGPAAYGFLLRQDLSDVRFREMTVPQAWHRRMVPITQIEDLLNGWATLDWLRAHDRHTSAPARAMAAQWQT
jgi:endonuclease G